MRRRPLAIAVLLVLVAAAGVAWDRQRARVFDADPGAAAAADALAPREAPAAPDEAAMRSPSARPAPDVAPQPLPPLDAPLDGYAEALAARAEAGDSAAACRLGLELMRCKSLHVRDDWSDVHSWQVEVLHIERGESQPGLSPAQRAAEAERQQARVDRYGPIVDACRNVPVALRARGPEFLRAAAIAGEPEARLVYAAGAEFFAFGLSQDPGWMRAPEFDLWRRDAPRLLQRALAAGQPEAVLLYADGTAGGEGGVQGLLPDDPQQAAAWRALSRRMFGSDSETLLQTRIPLPGEVDLEAAEAQAATWHDRYFDGATFRQGDLLARRLVDYQGADEGSRPPGSGCGTSR